MSSNTSREFLIYLRRGYELTAQSTALPEYAQAKTIASKEERETAILSMLTAELSEFSEAIAERRQPAITARDGQQVLAVPYASRTFRPHRSAHDARNSVPLAFSE